MRDSFIRDAARATNVGQLAFLSVDRVIRLGVYVMVLLVPLAAVTPGWLYIEAEIAYVEAPKVLLLRVLSIILVPFIIKSASRNPLKLNWLALPVLIWAVWSIIAMFFSRNPAMSMFGEFPGQDGTSIFSTSHFVILYFGVLTGFRSGSDIRRLIDVVILSGILASIPVLLQYAGVGFQELIPSGVGRPSGTFGNPVFAGGFISLAASLALASNPKRNWWVVIFLTVTLLAIESRAGLLGLGATFLWVLLRDIRNWKPEPFELMAVVFLVSVIGFTALVVPSRFTQPGDISGRLAIWNTSVQIIADNPLTGVGPDLFRYAHLEKAPGTPVGLVEEPDHAHNAIIHDGAEKGVPGALSAAALLLAPVAGPYGAVFLGKAVEQTFGLGRVSDLMLFFVILGASHNALNNQLGANLGMYPFGSKLLGRLRSRALRGLVRGRSGT